MMVLVVKVPSGRTTAPIDGTPANSWVEPNALDSSWTPPGHSQAAASGPTAPDRVTPWPAVTDVGLTWSLTGSERAHAGVVIRVRMAKTTTAMLRTGRMVTPPRNCTIPCGSLRFSVRWAGHGLATGECRDRREPDSTWSRSAITTSTTGQQHGLSLPGCGVPASVSAWPGRIIASRSAAPPTPWRLLLATFLALVMAGCGWRMSPRSLLHCTATRPRPSRNAAETGPIGICDRLGRG
jgi:hypothetical protein